MYFFQKKVFWLSFVVLFFALVSFALASFNATSNVTMSDITFGSGSTTLIVFNGSTSDSIDLTSGVFSINEPGLFKVGSANSAVKTILAKKNNATAACEVNTTPGTSYVTIPAASGTYTIEPSANISCPGSGGGGGGGGGGNPPNNLNVTGNNLQPIPMTVSSSQAGQLLQNLSNNTALQLSVPAGAVSSPTTFSITELPVMYTPPTASFFVNNQIFSITATTSSGQAVNTFSQPLDMLIRLANWPQDMTNVDVFYYSESSKTWIKVENPIFDVAKKEVRFSVNHLTMFALIKTAQASERIVVNQGSATNTPSGKIETKNIVSLIAQEKAEIFSQANQEKYFIDNGTATTKNIGAGERGAALSSYKAAYGLTPKNEANWNDVLNIANGRWPLTINKKVESLAYTNFKKVYGRNANMKSSTDVNALKMIGYGVRATKARDLKAEKEAMSKFVKIFKASPKLAWQWNLVRAIAYSGVTK